jgi:CBS domain-containing protein
VAGGGVAGSNVFEEHVVAEVMSTRLVSISPCAELRHAAELMSRAGVHRLLVLDDGRLAGLVTATDVLRAVAGGELLPARRSE